MEALPTGGPAIVVENHEVRREVDPVDDPTLELLWVVDVIVLRVSGVVVGRGPRQNAENSIRGVPQGVVERLLRRARLVALPTVPLVVFSELLVRFYRFDDRAPLGLPVGRDVKDRLHEDLEVDENSAAEIFADVILVILALVSLDSVRIAFLVLANR